MEGYSEPQDVLVLRVLLSDRGKQRLSRTQARFLQMLPIDLSAVYGPGASGGGGSAAVSAGSAKGRRHFRGVFELAPNLMVEELLLAMVWRVSLGVRE